MPQKSAGDKTVKIIADRKDDQQSASEVSQEDGGADIIDPAGDPPLRNGGEIATTAAATDEQDQRDRLANWARSAPIDHVRQVLDLIESFEQAEPASSPEDSAASKAA